MLHSDSALQAVEVMSDTALPSQVTFNHIYLKFVRCKTPLVSLPRYRKTSEDPSHPQAVNINLASMKNGSEEKLAELILERSYGCMLCALNIWTS